MAMRIVIAANTVVHSAIMRVMTMSSTIGADRMVVMICIAVIPIQVMRYAVIWMPPTWPIIPVIRRMPTYPTWAPKPIIYHWTIDIHWLYDIIRTIDIFVTYHLYRHLLTLILLHID